MEKERRDPKEKKCAACGKDMYAGEDWAYKRRKTGQRTKWFCSYKCMRAWDAKHDGKNAAVVTVDEEHAAPKEPVSRAVLARALAKEIKNGGSVIAYLTAEGYKNPYEAYNSVRHYCETKAPELAEVLKPLKDLPKAPAAKTGRPRKYPAKVETVDKVPEIEHECGNCKHKGKTSHEPPCDTCPDPISCRMRAWEPEEDLQPVQCIAHVTAMDIEEVHEAADANRASFEPMPLILRGGVDYQLKIDEERKPEIDPKEAMAGLSKALSDFDNKVLTREKVLQIVDQAVLDCQAELAEVRETKSADTFESVLFQTARAQSEDYAIAKLRRKIRKMLGADKE